MALAHAVKSLNLKLDAWEALPSMGKTLYADYIPQPMQAIEPYNAGGSQLQSDNQQRLPTQTITTPRNSLIERGYGSTRSNSGIDDVKAMLKGYMDVMNDNISTLVVDTNFLKRQQNFIGQRHLLESPLSLFCRHCQGNHLNKNFSNVVCGYCKRNGHLDDRCWNHRKALNIENCIPGPINHRPPEPSNTDPSRAVQYLIKEPRYIPLEKGKDKMKDD